jgi:hypothetical protein
MKSYDYKIFQAKLKFSPIKVILLKRMKNTIIIHHISIKGELKY